MDVFTSFINSAKKWFAAEAEEANQSKKDLEEQLDADLTRREEKLQATPEERMSMIQDEIDSSNATFDEIAEKTNQQTDENTPDPDPPS